MTKQKQIEEEKPDPKAILKIFKESFKEDEYFTVDPEISGIESFMMEYAEHPDRVKEFFNVIAESISVEKLIKESGIDLKKEKELGEERIKEVLEVFKKQIEVNEELAKAINNLNKNIEIIEIFNENFQQSSQMKSKKEKIDKNIFDIDIPSDFWDDILLEEDFDDDNY